MNRRVFLDALCTTAVLGSTSGCLSGGSRSDEADISTLEVWNSDDSKRIFTVELFDSSDEKTFEKTVELPKTSRGHYSREVFSEAPDSAAKIWANVGNKTAERELKGYEKPVLLSVKFNSEHQLAIADFV
ncbi:hypothetical protein [Halorussus halophilus]|uniref:hypothetical protein n=1 Tax=Halorussus halophilus TaxID=2650975 RepID=UPI00130194E3|nr:hypothetical protein [Halorussus halophilus]